MPDPVRPGTTAPWTRNLRGPGGQLFGDPAPGPDETAFQVDNTSDEYYNSPYYKQHENDVEAVPDGTASGAAGPRRTCSVPTSSRRSSPPSRISFHAVGDTGASSTAADLQRGDASPTRWPPTSPADAAAVPAFLFHLGDVIYNFGEAEYYYDQFYEPFRPTTGRSSRSPATTTAPSPTPTAARSRTFPRCRLSSRTSAPPAPGKPQDAGGLARTTMTQPGVYFTLDAPFVSIIGLYTNVLEGPGVITDEGGIYPALKGDKQYDWLVSELQRLAPLRKALDRAVILACHHPPASADADARRYHRARERPRSGASQQAGFWPDAVLSGHAHIYQRFSRSVDGREIPYIVAGSGGHDARVPSGEKVGEAPRTWNDYTLLVGPTARIRVSDGHRRHERRSDPHTDVRVHRPRRAVGGRHA